jgi:hypothetical protein
LRIIQAGLDARATLQEGLDLRIFSRWRTLCRVGQDFVRALDHAQGSRKVGAYFELEGLACEESGRS